MSIGTRAVRLLGLAVLAIGLATACASPPPRPLGVADAPASLRERIAAPERFAAAPISEEEWTWLVRLGWYSDGSSFSFDSLFGARIGRTTRDALDRDLPASRHDFLYAVGRLYRLGEPFRAAADKDYLSSCLAELGPLPAWKVRVGSALSRGRYRVLRVLGGRAWEKDPLR